MNTKYIHYIRNASFGLVAEPLFGARVANGLYRKTGNHQLILPPLIHFNLYMLIAVAILFFSQNSYSISNYMDKFCEYSDKGDLL